MSKPTHQRKDIVAWYIESRSPTDVRRNYRKQYGKGNVSTAKKLCIDWPQNLKRREQFRTCTKSVVVGLVLW